MILAMIISDMTILCQTLFLFLFFFNMMGLKIPNVWTHFAPS